MESSAHFSRGHIAVAFVLSVPGEKEMRAGRPVAGDTGANLALALTHLHAACPSLFPSIDRYDYRITNAFSKPIASSRGDGRSEAGDAEILDPHNVQRVVREIEACKLVILCGDKAGLLARDVREYGRKVVKVPHVGNKGLNRSYKVATDGEFSSPIARRERRVQLWAKAVLEAIAGQPHPC
jgi:hypothetical protein